MPSDRVASPRRPRGSAVAPRHPRGRKTVSPEASCSSADAAIGGAGGAGGAGAGTFGAGAHKRAE
eukprot:8925818-Alexandrium_andersonii.AAC.1